MRADVKKPERDHHGDEVGDGLQRLEDRRDDVIPEEDLDQQRDVAEQLRPRVADPHQRLDRRGAQDAHERAHHQRDDERDRRTRAASSPTPTSSSEVCPAAARRPAKKTCQSQLMLKAPLISEASRTPG